MGSLLIMPLAVRHFTWLAILETASAKSCLDSLSRAGQLASGCASELIKEQMWFDSAIRAALVFQFVSYSFDLEGDVRSATHS